MDKQKLPDEVLAMIHFHKEHRPSKHDSNFNYVHQENVFTIAELAYKMGQELTAKSMEHLQSFPKED